MPFCLFVPRHLEYPNSRQMESAPHCTKIVDDVLFLTCIIPDGTELNTVYYCIHIPSLVISSQLQGGSLCLTENALAVLLPKCIVVTRAQGPFYPVQTQIYSISACSPTHPRYCFTIRQFVGQSRGVQWEVLEVEIDLSIPGPIKILSRVGRQYTVQRSTSPIDDRDDDLLLYIPLRGGQPRASPSVRFLRVGKPDKWRVARLGGIDKMHLCGMC